MSELGDLLERIHGARHRWRTVQAHVHQWTDAALMHQAWERHAEEVSRSGGGVVSARGHGEPPQPGLAPEPVERVWIDGPGRRFRTEREGELRVRVGDTWWHYDANWGAMSNEGETQVGSGGHDLEDFLDPAPIAGLLDLRIGSPVEVDGRGGREVTATPRRFADDRHSAHAFHAFGATDYLWVVDDERGVLLRLEVRLDGEPYQITELRELVFDETLADEVFVFTPPPGEVVRSPSQQFARVEHLTIEEAAARAPFTVLVPSRLPEGAQIEARFHPGVDRPPTAPWVHLTIGTADRLHRLTVHQAAEPMPDGLEWEEEQGLAVCEAGGQIIVKRESLGTHVRLQGDFDRATMIEIATSLRPAPTEPPPLTDATPAP